MTAQVQDLGLGEGVEARVWLHSHILPIAPHRHEELEVNLVLGGEAAYLIDHRRYQLEPDVVLWLFPDQDHHLLESSADFQMWIGVFRPSLLRRTCTDQVTRPLCRRLPSQPFISRLPPRTVKRLSRMFRDCEATGPAGALFHAMCAHLVLQAWTQHLGADNVEATSHLHPAVERTVRLLRADSSEGIDDLAKRSGLSAPQLSRLFKEQVGIPITHFRQRQRLERFVDIYGTGQRINLMDAALEAGFGSYPQFHRVFKEAYGYSPAEHRRRMKLDQE